MLIHGEDLELITPLAHKIYFPKDLYTWISEVCKHVQKPSREQQKSCLSTYVWRLRGLTGVNRLALARVNCHYATSGLLVQAPNPDLDPGCPSFWGSLPCSLCGICQKR